MHPHEFRNITDHIYEAYCNIHDELIRTKKENKMLIDELNKLKCINNSLSAKLTTVPSKILKMGANWFIDGENLLNLSLVKKLKFTSTICNVKISNGGLIAFSSNRSVFVMKDLETFRVEGEMVAFDPKTMKTDLCEFQREFFDFVDEDLVVYQGNRLRKFNDKKEEWCVSLEGVICLQVENKIIYVGTVDSQIFVYSHTGEYKETVTLKTAFTSFIVRDGHIATVYENTISIDSIYFKKENGNIISYLMDDKILCYSGSTNTLKVASAATMQPVDTLAFKRTVLSVHKFRDLILVSAQDKTLNVVDLESKKIMRITGQENIVDLSCNDRFICGVDNNGGLSVWENN